MSFPVSPSNTQLTTVNGIVYQYRSDKDAWIIVPSTAVGSADATANAAYNAANGADILAQAAFDRANTALFKSGFDNGVTANVVIISNTTASISNTTGALRVAGGVGISGNLYVSGNIVDTTGNTYLKQDNAGNVIISGTLVVNSINVGSFLQNAFNKANAAYNFANTISGGTAVDSYARIVANSTAIVANIVAAGLVSTNTNTAIALAGVAAANSNINFLTGFSQNAFNKANAAYDFANTLSSGITTFTQGAYDKANSANVLAQSAYDNSNTKFSSSGGNINGDVNIINNNNLVVTGNLTVQGNLITTNTQSFEVSDPLILLGTGNYFSDLKDIGFASHYNDGVNAHAGFVRDFGTKEWYLFKDYTPELGANNQLNITDPSFRTANLNADIVRGNLIGTTAVVNNIELGGFTASAYDKANTTATVANSTAVVANIVAAGLVATNTNTAIALAGVAAANSNISFLTGFSQGAYDKANTALQNTANIITAGNLTVSSNLTIGGGGVGGSITGVNTLSSNTINVIDVILTGNLTIAGANVVNSLTLANSNISFLTGFSQGAYDKANTTATVANSTAVVANIIAAGLVATNTNTAIALAGVAAANSNISFLTGFSQNAFNKANAAYDYANTISGGITTFTQGAYDKANSASSNTVVIQAVDISQNANIAIALAGVAAANSNINFLTGYSQGAYALANVVQAGLNATNTNVAIALAGVDAANANIAILFNSVNSGNVNSAGLNAANANISFLLAFSQGAYDKANAANVLAQAAFDVANTAAGGTSDTYARGLAQGAYNKANAAYDFANTISGSSSFGGGTVANATYFANNTISTSPITGALRVAGGFGVGGDVFIAGNLTIGEANVINSLNLANSNISFLTSFSQGAYDKANAANVLAQASYNSANIIQAGLVAANSNISFLTSFSQGAYTLANITQAGLVATNTNTAIALAGVAAANSNIDFLIGYSQGAYALANVAKAGLDATNTNVAIALAGVAAANSNISFLTGFSQGAYDKANASNVLAQAAFDSANIKLSLSGGTIAGNVTANSFIANNSIYSPVVYSTGATTKLELTDIGLVGIAVAGQTYQFGASGIESNQGVFGGSFGGNRLSLNNETNLISNRYDTVKIQTGTTGTVVNEWSFSNNTLIFPDNTVQRTAYQGFGIDNVARITANSTAVVANIVAAGLVATNTNTAIALAGVAAANSNISFLTGFSQGAYDKANTTAAVANAGLQIAGWTPNTVIFSNSAGYLSNTTGFQFYSTNNTGRIAGTLYVKGETGKSALIANGYNQRGGTGYQGFLEVTNEYSGATTPSKFFRLDQAGSVQIRNSGDTQTIFQLADDGEVTIPSALKSNFIQFGDGSQQWTANAGSGGGGITVTTAPTPPASGNTAGSQWYNTTNDILYEYTTTDGVYYYWIDMASPAFSSNAITFTGVSSGKAIAFSLIFGG
jgi:hypothetical protein